MFMLLRIIGTPSGAPQPARIEIGGMFSCPSGSGGIPVELRIIAPPGGPTTTFSQVTSAGGLGPPLGSVVFDVPAWAPVVCGAKIEFEVRGNCGTQAQPQWTSWQSLAGEIECLCPRVGIQATYGACSGNPLRQNITLTATVRLKPGATTGFTWDFGDGQGMGASLTNTTASWNTPLTLVAAHDYDPGSGPYYACLSSPECPPACIDIQPNCNTVACPQISGIMSPPGNCDVNGNRAVTLTANFTPPIAAGATASITWIPGGNLPVRPPQPVSGPSASATFDFPPGGYSPQALVALTLANGTVCNTSLVPFGTLTVAPCPAACPTLSVAASVSGCASTNALASLSAQLAWPSGNGPAVSQYLWTVDGPNSVRKAQRTGPSSVDTASGWTGTMATVPGAVDLSQPGTYTVSVRAVIPGGPPSCDPTDSAMIVIPPCRCPAPIAGQGSEWNVGGITAPLGPNTFQTATCDSATVSLALAIDPGDYAPGDLRYSWDFGDQSPVVTVLGSAGASQNHTFTNPMPGQSRTYTVTVTVSVPDSPCPPFSRVAIITVPGCGTSCPKINQLQADRASDCINSGGSTSFTFTANVANPGSVAGGFQWTFGDGTSQTTTSPAVTHSFSSTGSFTVKVAVNGPPGTDCPASEASTSVSVTPCGNGENMNAGCWILLVISLILSVAAVVFGSIAACLTFRGAPPTWPPNLTTWLIIGAIAAFLLSIVFLLLWYLICVRGTNCRALNAGRHFVWWITRIAPIVGLIAGVLSGIFSSLGCGLFTGLLSAILWGYWGLVLSTLDDIAKRLKCYIEF